MADGGPDSAGGASGTAYASPPTDGDAGSQSRAETLVQYIVLREDLRSKLSWPTGSLVAQGAHAATAVLWSHRDDELVRQYLDDADKYGPASTAASPTAPVRSRRRLPAARSMHKIVLAAKNEAQLRTVAGSLQEAGIGHKLWVRPPPRPGPAAGMSRPPLTQRCPPPPGGATGELCHLPRDQSARRPRNASPPIPRGPTDAHCAALSQSNLRQASAQAQALQVAVSMSITSLWGGGYTLPSATHCRRTAQANTLRQGRADTYPLLLDA